MKHTIYVPSSRIEREAFHLGGERSILLSYEGNGHVVIYYKINLDLNQLP